jgi:hypothetical protein
MAKSSLSRAQSGKLGLASSSGRRRFRVQQGRLGEMMATMLVGSALQVLHLSSVEICYVNFFNVLSANDAASIQLRRLEMEGLKEEVKALMR